jgi:hypothetical protein
MENNMKFAIIEGKEKLTSLTQTGFKNWIKENCNQYFKENSLDLLPLYRGISTRVSRDEYMLMAPRKDRYPKDMRLSWHKYLDQLFLERTGWRARSQGIFATGNEVSAGYYGTVYIIYPADGYKYLWSPEVSDLYTDANQFEMKTGKYRYRQEMDMDRFIPEDEEMENHFREIIKTYKNDGLVEGIRSGNEIMIKCARYACAVSWEQ